MKTEEDEAFDDIARRQGGGGFQAKRAMVMDKVHAEFYEKYVRRRTAPPRRIEEDDDIQVYKRPWVGLTGQEKELIASVSLDVHDAVHRTDAKLKEKNT